MNMMMQSLIKGKINNWRGEKSEIKDKNIASLYNTKSKILNLVKSVIRSSSKNLWKERTIHSSMGRKPSTFCLV